MTDQVFDQVREYVSAVPVTDDVRERAMARVGFLLGTDNGEVAPSGVRSSSQGLHFGAVSAGARLKVVVAVAASVAIVIGIVLAAHGSSPTHATSTKLRPAATTSVPPRVSKRPAPYPLCAAAQLSVSAGFYGEGLGSYTQTFTLTNRSGGTCHMGGWPRFEVVSNSGQTVKTRTQHVRQNVPPEPVWTTIVLKPGAKASFDVYNSDWNAVDNTACPDTSAARITPPGAGGYVSVRVQIPDCYAFFEIAPVVAGAKDNQPCRKS
jgi:hypothetical protein